MIERTKMIDEINILYNEIYRLQCLFDNLFAKVDKDVISRKWLEEHKEVISYTNGWGETETDEFVSWKNIESAPSVVPGEKEGKWEVRFPYKDTNKVRRCSNCGITQSVNIYEGKVKFKFCPYCGAKMKG